jgi:hypothetical protein
MTPPLPTPARRQAPPGLQVCPSCGERLFRPLHVRGSSGQGWQCIVCDVTALSVSAVPMIARCFEHQHPEDYGRAEVTEPPDKALEGTHGQ